MTDPMLPNDPATLARVEHAISAAFAAAAAMLDTFATENALMSDEVMALVNRAHTNFEVYYGQHIQDGWEWENAEALDVDPIDKVKQNKANVRPSLTHATEGRDA